MALADYFDALDRLREGKGNIIGPEVKITNDAVALEAGRPKGSIRKALSGHKGLVLAINEAAASQVMDAPSNKQEIQKLRAGKKSKMEETTKSVAIACLYMNEYEALQSEHEALKAEHETLKAEREALLASGANVISISSRKKSSEPAEPVH